MVLYTKVTVPDCSDEFIVLQDTIKKCFLPALFDGSLSDAELQLFALPTHLAGLGVLDPTSMPTHLAGLGVLDPTSMPTRLAGLGVLDPTSIPTHLGGLGVLDPTSIPTHLGGLGVLDPTSLQTSKQGTVVVANALIGKDTFCHVSHLDALNEARQMHRKVQGFTPVQLGVHSSKVHT